MKKYIFMTIDIIGFGGTQMYLAGKAPYLESQGWKVLILFSSYSTQNCIIPELEKYKDGKIQGLNVPPFVWPKKIYNKILKKALDYIDAKEGDEIIIESHNDSYCPWGEIIAEKIKAKHIFCLMNELYRGKNKYYEDKLDFYKFKFKRREIGGTSFGFSNLFGVKSKNFEGLEFLIDESPVQNVKNEKVEKLKRYDWNICIIARPEKTYIPTCIDEVFVFSDSYTNKRIQLVLLGDYEGYKAIIEKKDRIPSNLIITYLDTVIPIPRDLFKKIDVFIAGAGSARATAYEGSYVIIPDPHSYKSNGVLGYDTLESVYSNDSDSNTLISQSLTDVLVKKKYDGQQINYPRDGIAKCTEQNFAFICRSSQVVSYYGEKNLISGKKRNLLKRLFAYYLATLFPNLASKIFTKILKK